MDPSAAHHGSSARLVEPTDFIGLSQRLLRLAHSGLSKIQFLEQCSRLILEVAGSDELAIRLMSPDSPYWWRARIRPVEHFEMHNPGAPSSSDGSPGQGLYPGLETTVEQLYKDRLILTSSFITARGTVWYDDTVSRTPARQPKQHPVQAEGFILRSLAIVPFDVDDHTPAILVLAGANAGIFTETNIVLYEMLAQTLGLAIDDRRAQHALRERVKELGCLYAIARIFEFADGPVARTLFGVLSVIPGAWQFPDALAARITLDAKSWDIGDFDRVLHRQSAPIMVNSLRRGAIEVGYTTDKREFAEGVFLKEEEHLINAIAREIGAFINKSEAQAERDRLANQVRHAERLTTIGQLAAGLAHELNEPLGSILGFGQLIQKSPDLAPTLAGDVDKVVKSALQARDIIRKLMLYARQTQPTNTWVDINGIIEDCLAMLIPRIQSRGVRVVRKLDRELGPLLADRVQLQQVVVNLCVNAIQSMDREGRLTVESGRDDASVFLAIADTGTGMTPAVAERAFEPFFTTKNPEDGTGLGLSVVRDIVSSHGGTIDFETRLGHGSRFEVRFPASLMESKPGDGDER